MSKDLIKDWLNKFSDAENCNNKDTAACNIVGNLQENLNNMDLRFNKSKQEIYNDVGQLNRQDDCTFCEATDGLALELKDKWSRNKIDFSTGLCNDPNE